VNKHINLDALIMAVDAKMKCMFNPKMECTVYDVMKDLEADLKPSLILEKACPLCPKRPMSGRPERLER